MEPYRVRVIEHIHRTTRAQREKLLERASFNLYSIDAKDVLIDLLTDSGLCALSNEQMAAMMQADESYAGSSSYRRFESRIRDIFGFEHVIPVHQGRAAERLLIECLSKPGDLVPSNTLFETTRANCQAYEVTPADLPADKFWDFERPDSFKGDMNCEALEDLLKSPSANRVPFVLLTVTNNMCGDQPVSLANMLRVRELANRYGKPLYLDACRFAQNAWFIKSEEPGYANTSIREIVQEMFACADGCIFSAKKDALSHMGGFVATRSAVLARRARELLLFREGFVTYGGMTGRDMESIAVGLSEVLEEDYLSYRVETTRYLQARLEDFAIPMVRPAGGHAVYIDASSMLPHLTAEENPGQALAARLYLESGVRSTRIVLTPKLGPRAGQHVELLRLALPSRVYSVQHLDYVAQAMSKVAEDAPAIQGLAVVESPKLLGGFLARYQQLEKTAEVTAMR